MASANGYDYGVRQALSGKGVQNQDIGYNPTSGYVTVKGQNFMKPQKLYQGTNYTTQQDFNTAWDAYNKAQPTTNLGAGVSGASAMGLPTTTGTTQVTPTTTAGTTGATGTTQAGTTQTNETQLNDLIKMLMTQAQNPTPVDVNDIYASPQYAAQQAQAQRSAQQGIRSAQESMGSAGFGRSTALGERAQGIQNTANEYLQTQVLPQLMAAAQAEKQQQLQNQMSMLDPLMQQQQFAETTAQQRGALTGSFLSPEARQAINNLNTLKSTTEKNWMTMTPEQRTAAQAQGDQLRAQLQGMNVDPTLFGADVKAATAIGNVGQAGAQTQAAKEFEQTMAYTEARDKIADDRYVAEFDEDNRRFGLEYALDKAVKNRQLSQEDARITLAQAAETRQSESSNIANLYNIWEATGVAPAGIPGVREGTPIYEKPTAAEKAASFIGPSTATTTTKVEPINAKDSSDNYDYYENELSNSKGMTKSEAYKYIEGEKDFLTPADYKAIKEWIKTHLE